MLLSKISHNPDAKIIRIFVFYSNFLPEVGVAKICGVKCKSARVKTVFYFILTNINCKIQNDLVVRIQRDFLLSTGLPVQPFFFIIHNFPIHTRNFERRIFTLGSQTLSLIE